MDRTPPEWLEIVRCPADTDLSLEHLDAGEREAIALSQRVHADYIIVDDAAARLEASKRNIPVTGTLGVLLKAALGDLLELHAALERLQKTSFHIAPELIQQLLDEYERTKKDI